MDDGLPHLSGANLPLVHWSSPRIIALALALGLTGCTCGAFDAKNTRFACTADAECGADFSCVGGECVAACSDTSPCPSGLDCSDGRCVDRDECRAGAACGNNAECSNTVGAYECRCVTGYSGTTTTGRPATCVDVDECAASPDCGPLGVCANTPGTFECTCPTGTFGATVVGGPTSCSTVDRCPTAGMCGTNATCQSTAATFTCTCDSGFTGTTTTGTPTSCVDVDECSMGAPCGAVATCANSVGSFKCTCPSGYTGDSTAGMAATCVDLDECATTTCGANAMCRNTAGSFECSCQSGFTGQVMVGGPTVCTSTTGSCNGVVCGANATCSPGPSSGFQCTCNAGFSGATTTNGPATCTDLDECTDARSCGDNAVCMNSSGSYSCACASGFTGPATMGMPTTCAANGVMPLGSNEALSNPSVLLTQPVPAGQHLVLTYFGANSANSVTDTRGNTWTRLVTNSTCGSCGTASIWSTTVRDGGLMPGDTINVPTSSSAAIWVANAGPYGSPDVIGTATDSQNTTTPTVVSSTPVTEPVELVVGVFGTRNTVTLTLDAGAYDTGLTATGALSGIVGSRVVSGLSGNVTFSATSNQGQRFSGALATFYGVPQVNPTALTLSHTPNARSFTVGWAAGRSNGGTNGCAIQVQLFDGSWSSQGSANCDVDTAARTVNLPLAVNWYGSSWSSLPVRLMRVSDQAVIGTFTARLTCANRAASSTSTPTVDEDCDSEWDDHVCQQYDWVSGMVYGTTFAACTNGNTTLSKTCASANELETRYTSGMTASPNPGSTFSSDAVGTACQGSFIGAVAWTCTPSNCSYR